MFSGSARFGATAQRAGWTASGQVSKWRSASPRSRSLLPASFRWAFWCWFTIPTKGRQLARKFAGWWLRLSSGYGNLRASTAADSRKIIHTLPKQVKYALQTLPIQETPACYGRRSDLAVEYVNCKKITARRSRGRRRRARPTTPPQTSRGKSRRRYLCSHSHSTFLFHLRREKR